MTQAHKTYGAIVTVKEEWKKDLKEGFPKVDFDNLFFVVKSEVFKGHLHVIGLGCDFELNGFHDERFKTYKGKDLKVLKEKGRKVLMEYNKKNVIKFG